jgi:hypothetical protein
MSGGRPTFDPKVALIAVRLADRHVQWLRRRAKAQGVSVSEVLRQLLDQEVRSEPPQARPPTAKERREFDRVFAAFGLERAPRRRRRR